MGSRVLLLATAGALLAAAVATAAPAPRLVSATVVGDRATLVFTTPLAPRGRITVTVNGGVVTPKQTIRSGRRVQLVLPRAAYSDDVVRVHGLGLRTRGGARIRGFSATAVNRSVAGCTQELGVVTPGVATEGPTDANTFLAAGGLSVLEVHVDYADAQAQSFHRPFSTFATGNLLREISYGRAAVDATTRPGVVRMAKNFSDYAFSGPWGVRKPFFQDLVLRLDGEVDFRRYDVIVVSTLIKAGIFPVNWLDSAMVAPVGGGVVADGKELRHFAVFTGSGSPPLGVRTFLNLMGLPSLQSATIGSWDTLSLLAWHRRKAGWLSPTQTRCFRSGSLETVLTPTWSSGGVKQIVIPTARDRAIVLENRQRAGLDAGRCTRGILAYDVRTSSVPDPVTIFPAAPPGSNEPCGFLSRAPYDLRANESARVANTVTFQVLEVGADGSYRLRVTR